MLHLKGSWHIVKCWVQSVETWKALGHDTLWQIIALLSVGMRLKWSGSVVATFRGGRHVKSQRFGAGDMSQHLEAVSLRCSPVKWDGMKMPSRRAALVPCCRQSHCMDKVLDEHSIDWCSTIENVTYSIYTMKRSLRCDNEKWDERDWRQDNSGRKKWDFDNGHHNGGWRKWDKKCWHFIFLMDIHSL